MTAPVGVGIIGAGVISDTYLENLTSFPDVTVLAVGDIDTERARAKAEKYGVASWGTADEVLGNPDIQVVVNLTIPAVHVEVSSAAIAAGKHVWTEKPLGLDRAGTAQLLRDAEAAGLRIGSAPDTVLGPGFQSAKRAILDGVIGQPVFAQASFQTQGPDLWHPGPQFLFARGAGPLLDMGPYYLTALVSLLGPVDRVAALGAKPQAKREIHAGPDEGTFFDVEVPTTVQLLAAFESGQQAQGQFSFDSALERHGVLEIHGTEGTIVLPDPNRFEGPTRYVKPLGVLRDGARFDQPWIDVEQEGVVVGRGLGLLDMVRAIAEDRPHVATGELGYHVLDIMLSAEESIENAAFTTVESTLAAPVPVVPRDFDPFARTI